MNAEALLALFSLQGRVALVTGASGGIGRALAEGLALAGATVALNGRSHERLAAVEQSISAQGGGAAVFPADLSQPAVANELVEAVVARYGRLDILVNCAGVNQRMPIQSITAAVYDQIMDTNLRGVFFLSQAALPFLKQHGAGKVINIGSLTSTIGLADVSVYGMTKSAVAQLTKTMAIEWAPHNIQVNCLCPGFIATDLTAPLWADDGKRSWILDRLPNKRPGKPEDMVGLAIYLASSASDYMTGQALYVDGGFMAGSQW